MRIATHNVEFLFGEGIHSHSGKEWNYSSDFVQERINHFAKLFAEINADVLVLQEVASEEVIQRIIAKSGIDYSYFFATPKDNVGNVVLFKEKSARAFTIPAITSLPVFVEGDEDVLGSRLWSRRDFVHLVATYNNKPLHVVGIHIKSNFLMAQKMKDDTSSAMSSQVESADGLIRSELFRFAQAKKVREITDGLFAQDANAQVVVLGDFNAQENNTVFRMIRGENKKLPDTLISIAQNIPEQDRYSMVGKGKKFLIDHILVSKTLEECVVGVQILNRDLLEHDNSPDNLVFPGSDHAPFLIDLK